jgi:hypothetical protein
MEGPMTFPSDFDARQFLIDKIAGQATRSATALSEAEHRMLMLSLDDPGSAEGIPVEMLEDSNHGYEKKIASLLKAAYSGDRGIPGEQKKYKDALRRLKDSDQYILIIAADALPQRKKIGNFMVYAVIVLAIAAMIVALQIWTKGR